MKTLSKRINLNINQPTKLFLEDLENINSNITEIADSISIRNNDFEFENLPDLLQIKTPELTELKFIGYKNGFPNLFLFIYPKTIYLEAYNDEPMVLGVIEKVKVIIRSRKRPLLQPMRFLTALVFLGLVVSISNLVAIDSLLVSIISIVFNITVVLLILLSKNKIILTYSKNTTSFWKKNSDTIIVAIITSIMTLIIGYIFGKITGFIP